MNKLMNLHNQVISFPNSQWIISLDSFLSGLKSHGGMPPYSISLGLGIEDRFPFMLDLTNPKPGSILVVGNDVNGISLLINTISRSASELNSSSEVSYYIISKDEAKYYGLSMYPHCSGITNSCLREAGQLIIELASITEQRKSSRERGGTIMLIIDGLDCLTSLSDFSVQLNLKSLIEYGPKYGIWPIISINPNITDINNKLFKSIGMCVFQSLKYNSAFAVCMKSGTTPISVPC